jgi:hypothetical protein
MMQSSVYTASPRQGGYQFDYEAISPTGLSGSIRKSLFCGYSQRTLLLGNQLTTQVGIQIRFFEETHDALDHGDPGKDNIFKVMRGGMRQEVTATLMLATA